MEKYFGRLEVENPKILQEWFLLDMWDPWQKGIA